MLTLVTRAADEAQRTADALRAAGHEPLLAPLTEIRILPMAAPEGRFDGVVATSAHAFAALAGLPEAARAALAGAPLFA
ncbi:MAG: uroporphyrinogen-III synthase, partial [Methylobacteriaceae bacterium]|nr:uroporphyrinogen-III synthase [Methylobacteriaceae bacterium]